MLTLFQLLNLPEVCEANGVPVYDGCDREVTSPLLTCKDVRGCFDPDIFSNIITNSLDINNNTEIDINPTFINTNINFTWNTPIITVGNTQINLSNLLLNTNVYRRLSDPLQRKLGRSPITIENKQYLKTGNVDGMQLLLNQLGFDITVGLPHDFVTTPLGDIDQYDHNYWIQQNPDNNLPVFDEDYNPRRYVLTWYQETAPGGRVCGRAVRAEPQCCMNTLVIDTCMLGLSGGTDCNGRCQTIRDQVNGTEWVNICNVFNQQLTLNNNDLCYQLPGTTQADPYTEACIDLSETNNHKLLSYPGSTSKNHILSILNSKDNINDSVILEHIFNQTLVYDSDPTYTTQQNNTLCITQPGTTPDQCVELTNVNDHGMYLDPTGILQLFSKIQGQGDCYDNICIGRSIDLSHYYKQRGCDVVCECVMETIPDWISMVSVTTGGFWDNYLSGNNRTVYQVLHTLWNRYVNLMNRLGPPYVLSFDYEKPCGKYSDTLSSDNIPDDICFPCCEPCGGSTSTNTTQTTYINHTGGVVDQIEERKYMAKRWIGEVLSTPNYIEIQQPFNGVLDPGGGAENVNVGWYDFGASFDQRYGYDPVTMPASQMTIHPDLMSESAIKCIKKGIYEVFIDGPIRVNHFVHAFRIALVVQRGTERIIYNDRKIGGDPLSGSASVNNGYFKENKFYYVSCYKNIELLYGDILTLHVKIDANVSRPYIDVDPMTMGKYNDGGTSLWSSEDDRPFYKGFCPPGTRGESTWINYSDGNRNNIPNEFRNFNNDLGFGPSQYNGYAFVGAANANISISCSGEGSCTLSQTPHAHNVTVVHPAIPPHAPNYINALPPSAYPTDQAQLGYVTPASEGAWPSLLYPGRFLEFDSDLFMYGRPAGSPSYQPGVAVIRFIGPSTGGDGDTIYPDMPTPGPDFPYTNISDGTGFMFGIRKQQKAWNSQIEDFS